MQKSRISDSSFFGIKIDEAVVWLATALHESTSGCVIVKDRSCSAMNELARIFKSQVQSVVGAATSNVAVAQGKRLVCWSGRTSALCTESPLWQQTAFLLIVACRSFFVHKTLHRSTHLALEVSGTSSWKAYYLHPCPLAVPSAICFLCPWQRELLLVYWIWSLFFFLHYNFGERRCFIRTTQRKHSCYTLTLRRKISVWDIVTICWTIKPYAAANLDILKGSYMCNLRPVMSDFKAIECLIIVFCPRHLELSIATG